MSDVLSGVLADLLAESEVLDALVTRLDDADWQRPTPAPGWSVAAQIAHLAWTDEAAIIAAVDPQGWERLLADAVADHEGFVDHAALAGAAMPPPELLARWRTSRAILDQTLRTRERGARINWFGPPMSATSMATARFMETWAHSLDVHETFGLAVPVSDRIRHVAHLGVRTRGFAYLARGEAPPATEVRVELVAPSGDTWSFGPPDAAQTVTGPAVDFCRLVTQRIHRDDTALVANGQDADHWLDIAQAFAGPAGAGRARRSGESDG